MGIGNVNSDELKVISSSNHDTRDGMNCPSADILLLCHRAKLPPQKSKEIFAHIVQCKTCALKSKYIKNILKDENRLIREINALYSRTKKYSLIGKHFRFIHPAVFTFRHGLIAAIIVLIFIPLRMLFTPAQQPPAARWNFVKNENIELAYGPSQSIFLFFKWNSVPDSRYYFRDMIDSGNDIRWRNANIESFCLFSPPPFATRFEKNGERLFSYAISDKPKAKSNLPEFMLKK